jgi:hypothetical protein
MQGGRGVRWMQRNTEGEEVGIVGAWEENYNTNSQSIQTGDIWYIQYQFQISDFNIYIQST